MALTEAQRKALRIALGSRGISGNEADAIADAIDSGGNPQGAAVADLGVTTDLTGVDGVGNNAADLATTESRLDDIEAKIDELLSSLRTAGIIAS